MTNEQLLKHIAHVAHSTYGLTVWQWLPGHVGSHSAASLHNETFPGSHVGRAFDAYGTRKQMAHFARWVSRSHRLRLTEGIYNGRFTKLSVKRGARVRWWFWGLTTWRNHTGHVHVAI